jgi:hypothetical protein
MARQPVAPTTSETTLWEVDSRNPSAIPSWERLIGRPVSRAINISWDQNIAISFGACSIARTPENRLTLHLRGRNSDTDPFP